MHDLAVLFLHHADDATTRNNLACLRHFNPGVPVVPVSNWGVRLPGGFHLRDMKSGWRKVLPSFRHKGLAGAWRRLRLDLEPRWIWRNTDLPAYFWILWKHRPVQARRWVVIEWDMYCNAKLADWYAPNWDLPLSSMCVQIPGRNDEFHYFNDREKRAIPARYREFLGAANPWAGMLLSDETLNAVARRVQETAWCNCFCEVRVATAAKSLGIQPAVLGNALAGRTLSSHKQFELADIDCQSLWHRVKRHEPLTLIGPEMPGQAVL